LENYSDLLNAFEKKEISQYENIFYIGHKREKKKLLAAKSTHNNGYDNETYKV
jgi:hypothetical protein